jgi:NAD(P)-dependent dehydrogenase (short-subunit alcohol dehydrogenase family)
MEQEPVLIAGGSRGIGRATAEHLISQGMDVITVSRSGNGPEQAVKNISWDLVENPLPFEELPDALSGFVYCPGSIDLKPIRGIREDAMRDAFETNVIGAVKNLQSCLPALKKVPGSSVLLFSTVAVQKGMPFHTSVAASKGAIEGITRSLAAELAPGIRVNCIAPSLTRTDLSESLLNTESKAENAAQRHPLKRVGETHDIASLAAFLLGPRSSWITGQVIGVDGGLGVV